MPAPTVSSERQDLPDVRIAAAAFSVFLTALGLSLSWSHWRAEALIASPLWVVPLIAVGLVLALVTNFEIVVRGERFDLAFTEVPAAFALAFLSPWLMSVIWLGGTLVVSFRYRSAWYKTAFNGALAIFRVGLGVQLLRALNSETSGVAWLFTMALSIAIAETVATSAMTVFVRWAAGRPRPLSEILTASGQSVVGASIGTLGVMTAQLHGSLLVLPAIVMAVIALASRQHMNDRQTYQDLEEVHGFLKTLSGRDPSDVAKQGLEELRRIINVRWTVLVDSSGEPIEGAGEVPLDVRDVLDGAGDPGGDAGIGLLRAQISADREIVSCLPEAGSRRRAGRIVRATADLLASAIDRANLQLKLDFDATHDPLTGLLARSGLLRRSDRHLQEHEGAGSMLVLKLSRFTEVNNTLGFKAGDLLLREVAQRLSRAVRDDTVLARLDGESFAIFIPDNERRSALDLANRVRNAMQETVALDGVELTILIRIGIAIGPGHGTTTEQLLRAGDVASDLAMDTQPPVVMYRAEADIHSESKLELLHHMRRALEAEAFEVWFQPKTDTISGLVVGAEALLRWNDHDRWIPPDEFIPAAEAAGMMNDLTDFVLRRSLSAAAAWRDAGHEIGVAVNLSPSSLEDPQLPSRIASELRQFDVAPPWLTIEITESVVMGSGDTVAEGLQRLRALGIRLSVDDFGTGYSSLRYLKDLDVDELKLDRSFVQDLAVSDRSETIARAVVGLGHSLGLRVVAEGVETPEARKLLQDMGCD
ncbi:MAG: bifunctional diguanylate cyclase/phosphodiesterase, partial [Acidimicrobiales bacterium]|nr:bifunctional diguanylate cyclase/phosphodiesterase [Acidimicrobiales bacterium]